MKHGRGRLRWRPRNIAQLQVNVLDAFRRIRRLLGAPQQFVKLLVEPFPAVLLRVQGPGEDFFPLHAGQFQLCRFGGQVRNGGVSLARLMMQYSTAYRVDYQFRAAARAFERKRLRTGAAHTCILRALAGVFRKP